MKRLDFVIGKMDRLQLRTANPNDIQNVSENPADQEDLSKETVDKFRRASSIADIEQIGFTFDEELFSLTCNVCSSSFMYEGIQLDFTNQIQSSKFRQLKSKMKKHLTTNKHLNKVSENNSESEEIKKSLTQNQKAGFNVGRITYTTIKQMRSQRSIEIDLFNINKVAVKLVISFLPSALQQMVLHINGNAL